MLQKRNALHPGTNTVFLIYAKTIDRQLVCLTLSLLFRLFFFRPKYLLLHLKRFIQKTRPIPSGPENDGPNGTTSRQAVEYFVVKNKAKVKIEEQVSLDPFCLESSPGTSQPSFHLRGLIHHHGSFATSGHYTADSVRPYRALPNEGTVDLTKTDTEEMPSTNDPLPEEEWIVFDDGNTCKRTLPEIQANKNKQQTVYVLLYAAQA
jgi:hypothetical protein